MLDCWGAHTEHSFLAYQDRSRKGKPVCFLSSSKAEDECSCVLQPAAGRLPGGCDKPRVNLPPWPLVANGPSLLLLHGKAEMGDDLELSPAASWWFRVGCCFCFFFLIIILPGIKELGEATCPPALSPGQPALPLPASQKFRVEEGEEDICVWALAGEKYVRVPTWELCSMHWAVSPELQVASPWVFLCLCPCALTNQCQMSEKNYQDHYSAYWDKAFMFSWEK